MVGGGGWWWWLRGIEEVVVDVAFLEFGGVVVPHAACKWWFVAVAACVCPLSSNPCPRREDS